MRQHIGLILMALAMLGIAGVAMANLNNSIGIGVGELGYVTPAAPPSCSNELDFSQACNSQYLAVLP